MIHTLEIGEVLWGKKSCPEMQHTTSIGATSNILYQFGINFTNQ